MKNFLCKAIPFAFVSLFCSYAGMAQEDLNQLLEAGLEDANTLVEGYVEPAMTGFGTSLANGWYNTAKAHRPAGFDLTITVNAAYVPDDDLFYTPTLQNTTLVSGDRAPTIFGSDEDADIPTYQYSYEEDGVTFTGTFDGVGGINVKDAIGIQAVPVPMAQLGVGLIKNTDIKIRWTPEIDIEDDGTFKLIGFGILHDVKQHIPGIKMLPFDLSAFIGFTDISSEVTFEEEGSGSGVSTENGRATFDVNTWTFQGLISKQFSILTLYGGLGFNAVSSDLRLEGDYTVSNDSGESVTYSNPINLSFSSGGPRLTAGARLKLAILTLHADYTLQEFNVLTVGLGFSFREQKN
ncbi:MAG: hypothetical protein MJA30_08895 [Cytophagales bacterium]|nr:hypothetical protein [Cytophagales bacterium]